MRSSTPPGRTYSTENVSGAKGQYDQGESLLAKKRVAEASLRRTVAADPKKQQEYGDAWDIIAKGRKELPSYVRVYSLLENGSAFNSSLFSYARALVRLAAEAAKPNAERLAEYTEARKASLEESLFSAIPLYGDLEKIQLANSLSFMRDELGAENAIVKKVLNGKEPAARAAELIDGSKLQDAAYRKQIAEGGAKAIEDSKDPMILLARSIDAEARAVRKRYETEIQSNERPNYAKIARALYEIEGTKLYPDATFTLRLSYGAVKGYNENGKWIAPFTTVGGLYQHAAEHGNKPPFQVPERWVSKKPALDLKTPFNFVSTNDIIGGNSGSPVVNANAEIVGLIFDGNIQSLVGNFVYDGALNRAVSVDSRVMIEALRKVYGANEVADELSRSTSGSAGATR